MSSFESTFNKRIQALVDEKTNGLEELMLNVVN
jgi:hypothetical protein